MTYDLDQQIARLIAEHFKSAPAVAWHNYSDRFVVILADGRKKILDHEQVAEIVKSGPQQPAKSVTVSKHPAVKKVRGARGKVSFPKSKN